MGGSHCLFGSIGVLDRSTFLLFMRFTTIGMTQTEITQNGIEVVGWLWLAWFGGEDTIVSSPLTVGTMSVAVVAVHLV